MDSFKIGRYLSEGVFIGGKVGSGFSLLDVRRKASKSGRRERIVIEVGDEQGRVLKARALGYYHVQVQTKPSRVVIDFAQMAKTVLTDAHLTKIFSNSLFIKSISLTMDPEDRSTNLTLATKQGVQVRVFSPERLSKRARKIVIDLFHDD